MFLKLVPNKLKVWLIKLLYKDLASKGRMDDTRLAHINDYEAKLLQSVGGSGTINPATGLPEYGGGGGAQRTTSTTTNLPEYARPFYEELLKQSGKQTYTTDEQGNVTGVQDIPQYEGTRVVGFTPEQRAVQQGVMGLQTPEQFGTATQTLGDAGTIATAAGAQGITGALGFDPGAVESLSMQTPGMFDAAARDQYMSPFSDAVTDRAILEAQRQGDIARSRAAMQSIGRGTFGGGREALLTAEADAKTRALIADLRAKGQQDAFLNAQQQFERDRAAGMRADEQTLAAERERRQMEQAGGQFAASLQKDLGLGGLGAGIQAGQAQSGLGRDQQLANLERLKAQATTAAQQQALDQEIANVEFQKFKEEQDAQRKLLEFQSNILRGTQGALGSTQVQYAPAPSLASQIGGLGIAGLGLYDKLS
tara:strand:+ start:98 stop:1366 length:1269 start_codon:yes stop_codon:yes gene_type:complete